MDNIKTIRQPTCNELFMEKFLRDRSAGRIAWRTKDGKWIPIKDLDYQHLVNIINMLNEQREYIEHLGDLPDL
jgi:hypothetical protein